MTYKEWFSDMEIRHDINEVYCLYRTVKERSSDWGYEVRICTKSFVVSKIMIEPHRFTSRSQKNFCDYLDDLYDLGIEGEYERYRGMMKK